MCDYKDSSTTFNGGQTSTEGMYLKIPGIGQINAITNYHDNKNGSDIAVAASSKYCDAQ